MIPDWARGKKRKLWACVHLSVCPSIYISVHWHVILTLSHSKGPVLKGNPETYFEQRPAVDVIKLSL